MNWICKLVNIWYLVVFKNLIYYNIFFRYREKKKIIMNLLVIIYFDSEF